MRYLLSCFFTLCFISVCFAETCPPLKDLHAKSLNGWQALHLESGTPLTPDELNAFYPKPKAFVMAEWMQDAAEGQAHCYYGKNKQDQTKLGVYLAHANLKANVDTGAWKKINDQVQQCVGHLRQCQFQTA